MDQCNHNKTSFWLEETFHWVYRYMNCALCERTAGIDNNQNGSKASAESAAASRERGEWKRRRGKRERLELRRSAWPGRTYTGIQSAAAAIINTAPNNTVCDWRMPTGRPVGREKHSFVFASSHSIIYGNVTEGYRSGYLSYTLVPSAYCSDWIVYIDMQLAGQFFPIYSDGLTWENCCVLHVEFWRHFFDQTAALFPVELNCC